MLAGHQLTWAEIQIDISLLGGAWKLDFKIVYRSLSTYPNQRLSLGFDKNFYIL